MLYPDAVEILVIHARLIDITGGIHGVRDLERLRSAAERPKMQFGGVDLYVSPWEKAAAYFESVALHHPFVDGNKRTAIVVAARFLYVNGYKLIASNQIVEKFVLTAVSNKYDISTLAAWFERYTIKMK